MKPPLTGPDPAISHDPMPDVLDGPGLAGRVVRGGVLRMGSYVLTTLLAIGSVAALTRHLGPALFGEYTTIMSLVAIVSAITDSGMTSIGTREYATLRGGQRDQLLRNLLGLRVALTLVGVGVVVVWSLAIGYSTAAVAGGIGASLATVALVFQHTLTIPLSADLRLGALSALELGRQAAMVAAILVLVVLGAGLFPLLAITLLTNTLLIIPSFLLIRGRISLRPSWNLQEWSPLLRATIVFSLAAAAGTLYVFAAQILTGFVTSRYQAGLFAVSFRVFIVSAIIPGLVTSSALPVLSRAARDDRDRLAYVLQRILEASLIGGIGVALVFCAGAPFVVSVIAGPRYAAAAPVLEIQVWALVASFVVANWSYGLLSLHLHRAMLLANLASLAVAIGLTLVLAHADGARGAALATIGGEVTLAVGTGIGLCRGKPQYRPRAAFALKPILAGGTAAACAFVPSMPSPARGVVAAVVYTAVIIVTRALPPEFRELLPKRLRP